MASVTKNTDMSPQKTSPAPVRIAAIQTVSGPDVQANLDIVAGLIAEAAAGGARLIALPEYFLSSAMMRPPRYVSARPRARGRCRNFSPMRLAATACG